MRWPYSAAILILIVISTHFTNMLVQIYSTHPTHPIFECKTELNASSCDLRRAQPVGPTLFRGDYSSIQIPILSVYTEENTAQCEPPIAAGVTRSIPVVYIIYWWMKLIILFGYLTVFNPNWASDDQRSVSTTIPLSSWGVDGGPCMDLKWVVPVKRS